MAEQTLAEMQHDHKHWLAEIERWEGYLRMWQGEQAKLAEEFRRILSAIERHGSDLVEHARALEAHKQEIIACERGMVEHFPPGVLTAELVENHGASKRHHEQQRELHERIKKDHHTFFAALSMLRHEPFRGA